MKEINPITSKTFIIYAKKEFSTDKYDKKYYTFRDNCDYTRKYRGTANNVCDLRYKTPKEIPAVYHNGSKYVYYFIIKELPKEFEGQFECLWENTEKYIIFPAPINKELGNGKTITYKIKFIDSFRLCQAH